MLSSLLFIGTTLKDGGSPPGGRRPLRQLPRPSSLPPARAGPVRRPPARPRHSPWNSPSAHIPVRSSPALAYIQDPAAAAPPEALWKHWRVTGRQRAKPPHVRRGEAGRTIRVTGGDGGRGYEPLRRGRAGCTTAGRGGRGRAARFPRAEPFPLRPLHGKRVGRGDRHPSVDVSKLCGGKARRKGHRGKSGAALAGRSVPLRRAPSLGAGSILAQLGLVPEDTDQC